jgi:hypothetical protein
MLYRHIYIGYIYIYLYICYIYMLNIHIYMLYIYYIYIYIFTTISNKYICTNNYIYTTMSYYIYILYIPPNNWHILEQIPVTNQPTLNHPTSWSSAALCHKAAVLRTAEHLSQIGNPAERCQDWLRISNPARPGSLRHSSFGGTLAPEAFPSDGDPSWNLQLTRRGLCTNWKVLGPPPKKSLEPGTQHFHSFPYDFHWCPDMFDILLIRHVESQVSA